MYYNENTIVFLNNEFIKASDANVSLYSQTMHYGNGVFEGIRSYATPEGAKVFKSKEHYERLLFSAKKMHIPFNYSLKELKDITYQLLKKNNLSNAYIRPLVYLGEHMALMPSDKVNLFMAAWEWPNLLGDKQVRAVVSSYQRPNPHSCHVEAKVVGHYINSILATTEAKSKGFDEALLLDNKGFIAEGSGANFFYEKDGKLITSPKGNILMGITRATVIELANELAIEIEERLFTPEEVIGADSAFFCGTAVEVIGLHSLNDQPFKLKWEDSKGKKIQTAYKKLVTRQEVSAQTLS